MKNCEEIKELMSAYIDNEIECKEKEEFESHIESCQLCKEELEELKRIINEVGKIEDEDLPEDFHKNLHDKLINTKNEEIKHKTIMFKRYVKIASSVAACVLIAVIFKGIFGNLEYSTKNTESIASYDIAAASTPEEKQAMKRASGSMGMGDSEKTSEIYNGVDEEKNETEQKKDLRGIAEGEMRMKAAFGEPIAVENEENFEIKVDSLEEELQNLEKLVQQYGSILDEYKDIDSNFSKENDNMDQDSNDIEISIQVSNEKYDAFMDELNLSYVNLVEVDDFYDNDLQASAKVTFDDDIDLTFSEDIDADSYMHDTNNGDTSDLSGSDSLKTDEGAANNEVEKYKIIRIRLYMLQ